MTLMPSTVSSSTSTVDPPEGTAPPRGKLRAFRYLRSHSGSNARASQSSDIPQQSSIGPESSTAAPNVSDQTNQVSQEQSPYETWLESTLQSAHPQTSTHHGPNDTAGGTGQSAPHAVQAPMEPVGAAAAPSAAAAAAAAATSLQGLPIDQMPTIRLIPHQDPRSNRPSLSFPPTQRTLPHEDCIIRVGRYSERDTNPNPPANIPSSAPIGFKSKVVSRRHCEFWCSQGQWYIKDVKSSSGTFLNHIRLSQPNIESRPWPVNDGDVVQLGIDFRGGEEMIFRCVKIRVECNRAWQKTLNNYNVSTHKRLRDLGKPSSKKDSDAGSSHSSECAICLMSIAPCQSLFVAPCSHVWHYKCIRPILNDPKTLPQFLCPNCRAVTDLEADVEDPNEEWKDDDREVPMSIETPLVPDNMAPIPEIPTNGRHVPAGNDIDEVLARTISRSLAVREDDTLHPTVTRTSDLTSSAPTAQPNLLNRRGAAPMPSPFLGGDSLSASANDTNPGRHLRPATPTDTDQDASLMRTPTNEQMVNDGPMTPTNNAGPFVFDGSAGRTDGRRQAADAADEETANL